MKSLVYLFAVFISVLHVSAATHLTIDQANGLIFPEADSFEKETELYSLAQKKEIAKRLAAKNVPNGNHVWIAKKQGKVLGLVVLDFVDGKHEKIDYVVGIEASGRIKQVEVLVYRESQGYEIRRNNWRKQFASKDSKADLRLYSDIDNIGGATISCRNVTDGVKRLMATFELVLRKSLIDAE